MDRETYVTLSKSINYGDLIYHRKYFSCGLNGRVGWTVYQEDTIIFSILRNIEHFYTHIYSTATNNRYVIKFMSQNVNSFCVHYFQLLLCLWDMRLGCGCIYFFYNSNSSTRYTSSVIFPDSSRRIKIQS